MSFSRNLPDEGITIDGLVGVSDQPPPPNPIPHESIAFPFCFQQIKIPQMEGGKHTLPGHKMPLPGLHMCSYYTFLV